MLRKLSVLSAIVCAVALLSLARMAAAQDDFQFWTDQDYDPAIPSIEQVLGYAPGERITWHRDAIRYFEALADAAPGRVQLVEYGRTWEDRVLIYAVLSAQGEPGPHRMTSRPACKA